MIVPLPHLATGRPTGHEASSERQQFVQHRCVERSSAKRSLVAILFLLVCPHEKCKKVDKAAPEKNGSEKKNSQ